MNIVLCDKLFSSEIENTVFVCVRTCVCDMWQAI